MKYIKKDYSKDNICFPTNHYNYDNSNRPVQDGLNVSPAEMYRAAQEGRPITAGMNSAEPLIEPQTPGYEVSALFQRGMDLCQIWNAQMDAREGLGKAVNTLVSNGNHGISEGGM